MQTQTANKFINRRKANKSRLILVVCTCDLDFVWQPSFCLCVCVRLMREHQNKCLVEQTHCQLEQIFCQQFSYALVESARTENSKIAASPGTFIYFDRILAPCMQRLPETHSSRFRHFHIKCPCAAFR